MEYRCCEQESNLCMFTGLLYVSIHDHMHLLRINLIKFYIYLAKKGIILMWMLILKYFNLLV